MSAQPLTQPRYQAVCRVCRKTVAEFPILEIPIVGQPNDRARKVLTIMGKHMAAEHNDQFQLGLSLISDFQAWLIMSQFETGDPSVIGRAETVRAGMQVITRKFTLSDQQIQDSVVALDSQNQLTAENVTALLRGLRDALTEQGQYAPRLEPNSRLVV